MVILHETKEGATKPETLGIFYLQKEVTVPTLPSVDTRIEGFEIEGVHQSVLEDDIEGGLLNQEHGLLVTDVEFLLRGNALVPVIWMRVEYDRAELDMHWGRITPREIYEQYFLPQIIKYEFEVLSSPFE